MDKVNFSINGKQYSLSGQDINPETSLSDFLRYHVSLCGTKTMCQEGGCGACSVSVTATHPVTNERQVFTVNSCLVHILSCHGWSITTVEGVGNRREGYHEVQTRLATFNGTQCGYCTPGWVLNMYTLQNNGKKLTSKQIENSFGGNMCRCTGYRPILDAFKTFAVDVDEGLKQKLTDLEDLNQIKCSPQKCKASCPHVEDGWCILDNEIEPRGLTVKVAGSRWYKPYKVEGVFTVLNKEGTGDYCLVNGNTGQGVYPVTKSPKVFIDISSISALRETHMDVNLVLGSGMNLTEVMELFDSKSNKRVYPVTKSPKVFIDISSISALRETHMDVNLVLGSGMNLTEVMELFDTKSKMADFRYLSELHDYMDLIAHVPVRNIGTIGGNLALKNQHKGFPSDIFNLLTTVSATVTIMDKTLSKKVCTMNEFLTTDLKDHLIYDVQLPPLASKDLINMYKIMPRAQNAHAIQNAGFLFKLDKDNKIKSCTISYSSISPTFTRATETEKALQGLKLFEEETLRKGLMKLDEELRPVEVAPDASPYCRKMIALGLFYKAILNHCPVDSVSPRYRSGGVTSPRPVSRGSQSFQTDKSLWPLNQPMPKLEALSQCSGEVKYADDIDASNRDVHVAFVLSTICRGEIDTIDTADILKTPGIIGVYTAKDIPGKNSFTPSDVPWQEVDEEILASSKISYYGQPIALIAANTRKLALRAAADIKVNYKNVVKLNVLTIEEALVAPDKNDRVREEKVIEAKERGTDITKVIKGRFAVPSQYHYYMETQTCRAVSTEFGIEINVSTQWVDLVQVAVAQMLKIKENEVNVTVRRVGGAYGGKASRSALIGCAASLVASKVPGTVRLVLPLTHNTTAIGMRQRCLADYEVAINDTGVIQYLNISYYNDCGYTFNDSSGAETAGTMTNLYNTLRWTIHGYSVKTDKASNTWCRAPGTTEGTAIIEHIMERIAFETNNDSIDTKELNLPTTHPIKEMISSFKTDTDYNQRKNDIEKYNTENAWKKKSIKISLMSYPIGYTGNFSVLISIYHADGSVHISHAGIEMGQGINTKIAQVCAYKFKIPIAKVAVKATNSFDNPNCLASNGSITSESLAFATMKACDMLMSRLEAAKGELNEPTWEEIVKHAFDKGIDLQSSYMKSDNDNLEGYNVLGLVVTEVLVDVLIGTHQILRVDLLEDTGQSMSPDIDVGQIEGAFVMGLGLWTSECLTYDPTGRLLTNRTWNYKPPGVKDIPVDFRISFKRNSYNNAGVLRSKATGEPALVLAVSVALAIHDVIHEARKEYGYARDWVNVDTPYSVENIIKAISPNIQYFKLK